MDSSKPNDDVETVNSNATPPEPVVIFEKPADPEGLEGTPAGQLVVVPIGLPARRKRRNWLIILLTNRKAQIGGGIVLFFVLMALLAPVIAPGDPNSFVDSPNLPPSSTHLLGTDGQGKEVFAQTIWGARISLLIGFGTGLLTTIVSVVIGMSAGYFRGRLDEILTLLMNFFLIIPGLPLLIVLSAFLKPGTETVILVLALTGWAFGARVKRSQTLSLREKDFTAAAVVSGERHYRIIFQEILPNMLNIIVGSFLGSVVYAIGASTALSFIGLTNVSEVSWGTNLYWSQNNGAILVGAWWTFIPSGLCVAFVAFGLSLMNYAMDEVTNPRLQAEREMKNVARSSFVGGVRATPVVRRPH
jgi:peptide/nickel transport system permease protein